LGMRTLFNILGPMSNPAGLTRQLIGVYDHALCRPMTEVLQRLGAEHVMVVHSEDGLDEISLAADTLVAELRDGAISEYTLQPEQLGVQRQSLDGLAVEGVNASLELLQSALAGKRDEHSLKAANMVALNAGAALYVAGVSASVAEGVSAAGDILASGVALDKLQQLAAMTRGF